MKIYSVVHKQIKFKLNDRTYIGVGKNKNIDGISMYDNTCDNISNKNDNYCELTALYWIWKNDTSNYVGLEHYRRFFYHKWKSCFKYIPYSKMELEKLLNKCDIILPKKCPVRINHKKISIFDYYNNKHYGDDLLKCGEVIKDIYPEYYPSFKDTMSLKTMFACNMVCACKDIFDSYCKWLFDILFEVEKKVDIRSYDDYQKRIFGFLSERLFNVWVLHNKDKLIVKYLPICNVDLSPTKEYLKNIAKIIYR